MTLLNTLQKLNYNNKKRVSIKNAYSMLLHSKWSWEKHWDFNNAMKDQPHSIPNYAMLQCEEAKLRINNLEEFMAEVKQLEIDGIKTIKLN